MQTEYYTVKKLFRVSGRREIIRTNLTREQAKSLVNSYPDSSRSMVVFVRQNNVSNSKKSAL